MTTLPTVTVAVPVLNEAVHIEACLDAIASQTYDNIVEVLVIDGGSDDDTRALAARHGATVLDNPRRIQAAALNIALDAAKGDVFLRVDGHCELAPDYVERCIEALDNTGAAMVGGGMTPVVSDSPMQAAIAAAMTSKFGVGPARFHSDGRADWVDTVYLGAYSTELARSVGGYAEDVGVNEDAEFAVRMGRAGGIWFDPAITSSYAPRRTLGAVARQFRRYGWSRAHTIVRHPRSVRPRQLAPLGLLGLLLLKRTRRPTAALYVGGLIAVSGLGRERDDAVAMRFVPVAATMHLSWALGFVAGFAHALVTRR